MSVSPCHPDPACPDCKGEGRVPWDPARNLIDAYPCARCKARECHWCDAVLPAHEPGCAVAAGKVCEHLYQRDRCVTCLRAERDAARAVLRALAESDPREDEFTRCVLCGGRRDDHDDACPWVRARELVGA